MKHATGGISILVLKVNERFFQNQLHTVSVFFFGSSSFIYVYNELFFGYTIIFETVYAYLSHLHLIRGRENMRDIFSLVSMADENLFNTCSKLEVVLELELEFES